MRIWQEVGSYLLNRKGKWEKPGHWAELYRFYRKGQVGKVMTEGMAV